MTFPHGLLAWDEFRSKVENIAREPEIMGVPMDLGRMKPGFMAKRHCICGVDEAGGDRWRDRCAGGGDTAEGLVIKDLNYSKKRARKKGLPL
jgi:hypothetical protein